MYTILGCVITAGCEKELDFTYHEIDPITVIEGELTPDGIKVGITMTTPMNEPMDRTRLIDAVVALTDMTAEEEVYLTPDNQGYFTGQIHSVYGHDYRLTVERNGQSFASVTTMFSPVEILGLEFNWIKMPYDYVAILQCRFTDNPMVAGDCYWIKIYRNGEIYRWAQVDDRSAVNGIATYFTMTTRRDTNEEEDDEVLYDGDEITCSVTRISKSMHDYLESLQNNSNGPAMFEGDQCLGYFLASAPVSESIVFHPDEIPEYK